MVIYFLILDQETEIKALKMKLTGKDIEIQKLKREKENAEEKYNQIKTQLSSSQELRDREVDIDELNSARQKIIALQAELDAQTKYSNNMLNVSS